MPHPRNTVGAGYREGKHWHPSTGWTDHGKTACKQVMGESRRSGALAAFYEALAQARRGRQ